MSFEHHSKRDQRKLRKNEFIEGKSGPRDGVVGSEKGALLLEKETWLSKIREDNEAVAGVIKSLRQNKDRFQAIVRAVEKERLTYKAVGADLLESKVASEINSGLLSEHNRLLLPSHLRTEAETVQAELEMIAAKVRANQLEVLRLALNKIKDVEEAFVDRRSEEVAVMMDELRTLVAATPNNLHTARSMLADLPATVIAAIREEEKRTESALVRGEAVDLNMPQDEGGLRRQNEMLKVSLEQLRRRNTQLKFKLQRMRHFNDDSEQAPGAADDAEAPKASEASSDHAGSPTLRPAHAKRLAKSARRGGTDSVWESLEDSVRTTSERLVEQQAVRVVERHPLAQGAAHWIVDAAITEVRIQLKNATSACIDERLLSDSEVRGEDWASRAVTTFFRSAKGVAVSLTTSTTVLTYLLQRATAEGLPIKPTPEELSNQSERKERSAAATAAAASSVMPPGEALEYVTTLDPSANRPKPKQNVPRYMSAYKGRVSGGRGRQAQMQTQ